MADNGSRSLQTMASASSLFEIYFGQYRKTLTDVQVERIASSEQTRNTLFLRSMLEELRVFGDHEKLDEKIKYYLSSETIPSLFEKVLDRYENDYDRDRTGMVGGAMKLLWASRRGLSESELLELLGEDEESRSAGCLGLFYVAVEHSFVSRFRD